MCGGWAGLSISGTDELQGFSHTTVSTRNNVYSEWCNKEATSSEQQFCALKVPDDERGPWPDWLELTDAHHAVPLR